MAKADTSYLTSMSNPRWLAESMTRENMARFPAKVVASQFTDKDAITVNVTATAAISATSVSITAITFPKGVTKIPAGTWLNFSSTKSAKLTADYTGGTTITVAALGVALAANDKATYLPFGTRIAIESGTLVGRTLAERDANTGFGPWAAGDNEVFLLGYDISDASANNDGFLIQNLTTVKENYLPGYATFSLDSNWLTALRAAYRCIKGTN